MNTDLNPYSRIAKFPKQIRPFLIWLRDTVLSKQIARLPNNPNRYRYRFDGVAVNNSTAFMEELEFKKSYAALVKAYGWDPGMPWRVHQIIWAYKQIKDVNGSIVECGVGRGGLMSALLESCENWNETGRKMYLFDTFESYQYDKRGKKIVNEDGYKYYARSFSETKKNFSNYSNIEFVVGDVIKTVATGLCGEIALLSLDLNQADAEEHVMRKLFPNLSIGGVIILDDYYAAGRDLQRMRMNRLAEDLNFNILATPHGQGIIVKN